MLSAMTPRSPAPGTHRIFSSPRILWLAWLVWLPFLVPGIAFLLGKLSLPVTSVIALALVAVFTAVYAFSTFQVARDLSGTMAVQGHQALVRSAVVLIMVALSVSIGLLVPHGNPLLVSAFIFTAAYGGTAFRIPRAVATNAAVLAACLITAGFTGAPLADLLQLTFLVAVVSFMTMSWARSIVIGRKLHEAQSEIARLAAVDERLRIARDLHDLLGHKLSLLALKSELAERFVSSEPEKARAEIGEVRTIVRSTLQEVREAVAGYRRSDLAHELRAAEQLLSAAGISCTNKIAAGIVDALPADRSEALAWAVREGVTNVIRHSRARLCTISLSEQDGLVTVTILDDGPGASGEPGQGSGLAGLRERFKALGGTCEAQFLPHGGFRLAAAVPTGEVS